MLKAIALFRWSKAIALIAGALGVLKLLHPGASAALARWIAQLPHAGQNRFVLHAISVVTHMRTDRIEWIAAGMFAYAALFAVEGTGLWLERRWGEWLTVVATTSFIPFEIYELWRGASVLKAAFLVVNVAIVVYLLWRIRTRRYSSSSSSSAPAALYFLVLL